MQRILGRLATLLRRRVIYALLASSLVPLALMTADATAQTFVQNVRQICTVLEVSQEDCARIIGWRTAGNLSWIVSSFDPLDSDSGANIRSPTNPPDDTRLCLILDVRLPHRTRIEFHWRAETEVFNDYFDFYINDRRVNRESGGVGWREVSVTVNDAATEISWCYDRDGSGPSTHFGRFDRLRFTFTTIEQQVCDTLGMSSDDCGLLVAAQEVGGNWLTSNFNSLPSAGANLRSPQGVADDTMACLELTVKLPAHSRINFHWLTETEANSDYFAFYLNNQRFARNSGTVGWRLLSIVSPEAAPGLRGVSELSWCYERDSSGGDPNADHGRLDSLQFNVPSNPWAQFCDTLGLSDQDCDQINTVAERGGNWIASNSNELPSGGTNLRSPMGVANDTMACLDLTVNLPAHSRINFHWRIETEENSDYFAFYLNNERFARNSGMIDWHPLSIVPLEAVTRLSWCYERDATGGNTNADHGRVDGVQFNAPSSPWAQFCDALRMSEADCMWVVSVRNATDHPWEIASGSETFSGRGYQSDPDLEDDEMSMLAVTLAPGIIAGLEFYRRVESDRKWDWLVCEYNDNERGFAAISTGFFSSASYRSLPFFDGAGTPVQGDLSGVVGSYVYGNTFDATPDINLGDNNQWSLLRLLPTTGDITELRWIYFKDEDGSRNLDRAWIDSLRLHQALTGGTELCSALDLSEADCALIVPFEQLPSTRRWTIDEDITPAPIGGNALRLPLRVLSGEKTCLKVLNPIPPGFTVVFSWRLIAAASSTLTFELGDTVVQTLTSAGEDTGWTTASWNVTEAIDSFAWCYEGSELTRGWVDNLRTSLATQQFCDALRLSETDCARVESVDTSRGNPWVSVASTETLSGRGFQSNPNIGHEMESVLTATLAAGVVGLEFHRRVSSELRWDWLIFEYNDAERGSFLIEFFASLSLEPYRSLPFFDGAGTPVQGDLAGSRSTSYTYGDQANANSAINLGANREWSLLRLLPADDDITELRWIYRKDNEISQGLDSAWIDSLRLYHRVADTAQLCEALDINTQRCTTVASFAQQPSTRMWTIDSNITPAPMGGTALRIPLRVLDGERACLSLSLPVAANYSVAFFWRLKADSTSTLTFELGGTVVQTLTATSTDTGWTRVSRTAATAVDSFAWCYEGTEVTQAWVDALSFAELALVIDIAAMTVAVLTETSANGQQLTYSLQVQVAAPLFTLTAGEYDIALQVTGTDAALVTTLQVTSQAAVPESDDRLILAATLVLELQKLQSTVNVNLGLSGDEVGSQVLPLMLDVSAESLELICIALDIEQADCELLGGFSTTESVPWQVVTDAFQSGDSLLGSGTGVADDSESCLTLEFAAGSELPVGGRIDFLWGVDAAAGDGLQLRVGGTEIASFGGLGAGIITPHRQQRFAATAVSSLSWCYIKDSSGAAGADRGWIDDLQLLQPLDAVLLPATTTAVCTVLDMTEADCSVLGALSQTPDTLNWDTDSAVHLAGGSSLRTPQTVADGEMACLTLALQPNLPAGSRVAFRWRVDSAAESALELRFNGAALTPSVSISGLASEVTSDNGWQLHTGEASAELTSLGWCYSRVAGMFAGTEQGWVDNLQLYPAVATTMQLCETLDLDTDSCTELQSFAEQPPERVWTVDDSLIPAPAGGSALRLPFEVTEDEKTCLSLSLPVAAGYTLAFSWRLNAASGTTLTFEAGDTAELTLTGVSGDSGWTTASWTTAEAVDSFAWCYQGAEMTQAWVDGLSFTGPTLEIDIAAVTTPILTETSADGRQLTYSLQVRVAAPFFTLTAGEYGIALRYTGTDAARVTTLVVTGQTAAPEGDGALILAATLELELQQLQSTVNVNLGLSGDKVGSQVLPLRLDVSAESLALICLALDMEQADCELLGGFSTTESAPWQLATAAFQSGDSLLGSGSGVADDGESCLTLEFAAGSELPVAGRMDFLWAVDAATGDGLQLQINGTEIANFGGLGAGVITPHRQQRFATAAVSSLSWCYIKDSSGAAGADRSWVDDLELLQPLDAVLLPATTTAVCTVLDMSEADCAVVGALSQSPDTLNWDTDSAVHLAGGSSLRTPQTVTDGEMACLTLTLTLEPTLPAGTEVTFWWRVDSGAGSALELRFNGSGLIPLVSINGRASEIMSNNGWQPHTSEATAELSSLGWCYSHVSGLFIGAERGWVEQLRLNPPFVFPVFSLASAVNRLANNGIEFTLRLQPGSGEDALPAGVMVRVQPDNLENVVLTTVTASATAIDYRVTATVMETNDIARLRFTVGPLPPAVDPLPESAEFAVTIESQTSVDAAMLLSGLNAEPSSASPGISLNDLLLGLRLSTGEEVETVLANLGRNNGDRTAEMQQFTEFLADPERSGAVDINDDDVVDALDFRLMMRYLSGLRGEELLCDSLCEARLQILFSQ